MIKKIYSLVLIFSFLTVYGQENQSSDEQAYIRFERIMERLKIDQEKDQNTLLELYVKRLDSLSVEAQDAGDLDLISQVKSEKLRAQGGETKVFTAQESEKLQELQSIYNEQRRKIWISWAESVLTRAMQYSDYLQILEKESVREGRIEEAIDLRKKQEEIYQRADVRKAQEYIALHSSKRVASGNSNLNSQISNLPETAVVFGNSAYWVSDVMLTWKEARVAAAKMGARLLKVDGKEENEFVGALLAKTAKEYELFYTGGNDFEKEGVWIWQDKTAFGFSSWGPGEPNSYQGKEEDVMAMDKFGKWNDLPEGNRLRFVCEWLLK
jgi:hypothetical protein